MILAGVRIAAVVSVGTATIAAAIGAGGLGTYVFRGLATVDTRLILAGAVPAAAPRPGRRRPAGRWSSGAAARCARPPSSPPPCVAALVVLGLAGRTRPAPGAVVVGSKNFTEQVVLGEILAAALEDRGFAVDRRLNLGGTPLCHEAVRSGQLDVYVEYTGTALTDILKPPAAHDPRRGAARGARGLRRRWASPSARRSASTTPSRW